MKTNQKYLLLSALSVITVTGLSLGALSLAQGLPVLTCSSGQPSVNINVPEILTATGGNGVYSWSGPNLSVMNTGGNQFAVSYPTSGIFQVTVMSGGQSATCNVDVLPGPVSPNALSCFPATQNVTLGQTANLSVTGGTGAYVWSSPDLSISNPNGSGFSASYATTGVKTLTVTSGGLVTTCAVNVFPNGTITPPAPVTTPGLPNTGGGYGQE